MAYAVACCSVAAIASRCAPDDCEPARYSWRRRIRMSTSRPTRARSDAGGRRRDSASILRCRTMPWAAASAVGASSPEPRDGPAAPMPGSTPELAARHAPLASAANDPNATPRLAVPDAVPACVLAGVVEAFPEDVTDPGDPGVLGWAGARGAVARRPSRRRVASCCVTGCWLASRWVAGCLAAPPKAPQPAIVTISVSGAARAPRAVAERVVGRRRAIMICDAVPRHMPQPGL